MGLLTLVTSLVHILDHLCSWVKPGGESRGKPNPEQMGRRDRTMDIYEGNQLYFTELL